MNEEVFKDVIEKSYVSNDAHSINYVLDQIKEVHSEDKGWVVGEPIITPNPDGKTVRMEVPITKYPTNSIGRSR